MNLFTIAARNLRNRPARSLLTIAGIAIGIAAVVALAGLARGFERTWVQVYTARGTDLVVTRAGSLSPVPAAFTRDRLREIESLPGIARTSAMLSDIVSIENSPVVLLFGWESRSFVWDHLRLVNGRLPSNDAEETVVLGSIASEVLKKTVGAELQIETTTFRVCGVFESASLAENGAIVMTLPRLQAVTDQPGKINFLNVKLAPGLGADAVAAMRRTIAARAPGFTALSAAQVADRNAAIQAVKAMTWATSAIALVIGAVGIMNTMLMSVFERTHEIGILLAIGWRRRRILRMILLESTLLSLAGGLTGIVIGTIAVKLLERAPLVRGKIAADLGWPLYALGLALAVGLGVIGGFYPAYRSSRMRPSEALRYE